MASWMQEEAMKNLPIGVRFHPTDEELLSHYLRRKNRGLDEPDGAIPEIIDLCRWEPEELRAFINSSSFQSKNLEWWFFSEQKPGRTQNRSTKGGYWKKTGQTRTIKSRDGTKQVIGSKKILIFFRGNSSASTKTDWVMHEYLLASNALDDHFGGTRRNYVVCMIKCNSYETANSAPSYQCEQDELMMADFSDNLEAEPDNRFIPQDKIQEIMQSRETSSMNNNVNQNQHPNNSSYSSTTQLSVGRDSAGLGSSFCADSFNPLGEMLSPPTRRGFVLQGYSGSFVLQGANTRRQQLDKKKGIVNDDFTQSTASSLPTETPKSWSEEELLLIIISDFLSGFRALTEAPITIKEEINNESSSSTSTHKPREEATATRFGRHCIAANTTTCRKKEMMAAREKLARELKLMFTMPRVCSCSVMHYCFLLVSINIAIAIYLVCKFFTCDFFMGLMRSQNSDDEPDVY